MMTRILLARCAPLAIAASAAFPFATAAAQDTVSAEPAIVLPEAAPPPAIVLPETIATPAQSTVAEGEPTATVAAPVRRTAHRATVASSPVATAPAVQRAAPAATADGPVAPATAAVAIPAQAQVSAPEPVAARPAATDTGETALATLLAALGLGAVGAVAYAASRRRRTGRIGERETIVAAYPAAVRAEPAFVAAPLAMAGAGQRAPRANGDPVALPTEVPKTFEERDALLKELVAAEPDKANPFISPRARARRAKLIIQSLARDFTSRKPRIDLSEYTNRWPALRGWQPATA